AASGIIGFIGWLALLIVILIPVCFPITKDTGDKANPKDIEGFRGGLGVAGDEAGGVFGPGEKKARSNDLKVLVLWGIDFAELILYGLFFFLLLLLPLFLGMVYAGLVATGAIKAQNLESRGWGIASSIMVMFPINSGGFIICACLLMR